MENADGEESFPNDEDGEGGEESTIATSAPAFDSNVPSPITVPPQPPTRQMRGVGHPASAPQAPTAPFPFKPYTGPSAPPAAGAPANATPKAPPVKAPPVKVPPGPAAPPVAAATQKTPLRVPTPAAPVAPVAAAKSPHRAQTMLGTAPAPPGLAAQKTPTPANPMLPVGPPKNPLHVPTPAGPVPPVQPMSSLRTATPAAPVPITGVPGFRPGAKRGVTVIGIAPPATGARSPISDPPPPPAPTAPRAMAGSVPRPPPSSQPGTKHGTPRAPVLVAPVEDNIPEWTEEDAAARESSPPEETATATRPALVAAPVSTRVAPPVRPGSTPNATGPGAAPISERGKGAVVARNASYPDPKDLDSVADDATRRVSRRSLPAGQDASFIVDDAVGDDATLAVMPGGNAAHPRPDRDSGLSGQRLFEGMGAAAPSFHDPSPFSPNAPPVSPHGMMGHPANTLQANVGRMGSSPELLAASEPVVLEGRGYGGAMLPQVGAYPAGGPGGGAGMAPHSARTGSKKIKLTGQIVVLIVVGVVCLAVFVTGIVLFVTTRL